MHIPVGRNVRVLLESPDVIHSFWVPSLAGKMDLVPGRENTLVFRADRPGVYRGQCAEFCGLQHSHMAFMVMADDEASYRRWANKQKAEAAMPQDADALAGKAVFLRKQCAACHTVRGTPAAGTTGPDLTHVGSRRTIGAGLLETTRGSLAAWIADPQTLKPGNNMPLVPLTGEELRQVSAYMEGLD
jgi:cytochrome c oxidase subunit 2